MRIILSRKGFDSGHGGMASPLLPDGTILSLPIPEARGPTRLGDLRHGELAVSEIVASLSRGRLRRSLPCHLDPDLSRGARPRRRGWRPALGQAGSAAGHLDAQGVGPGDVFLFFGWFRETEATARGLRFRRGAPDLHVIFGWLQVGSCVRLDRRQRVPSWLEDHPHLYGRWPSNNRIYVAAPRLSWPGVPLVRSGGGAFPTFDERLRLTASGRTRSVWGLPAAFHPRGRDPALSYHRDARRWRRNGGRTLLETARIGQEFVLRTEDLPEAIPWAARILKLASPR